MEKTDFSKIDAQFPGALDSLAEISQEVYEEQRDYEEQREEFNNSVGRIVSEKEFAEFANVDEEIPWGDIEDGLYYAAVRAILNGREPKTREDWLSSVEFEIIQHNGKPVLTYSDTPEMWQMTNGYTSIPSYWWHPERQEWIESGVDYDD